MPKAVLRFNLPEEEAEFNLAHNGARIAYALQEFDNWLRAIVKHGEEKDQLLNAETVRNRLHQEMEGTGWRED